MPRRKRLSKRAREAHIASGGTEQCPFCRADQSWLRYQDIVADGDGTLSQEAQCEFCQKRWQDIFHLVDIKELS